MSITTIRPNASANFSGTTVTGAGGDLDAALRDSSDSTFATMAAPFSGPAVFLVNFNGLVPSIPDGANVQRLDLWMRLRTTSTAALPGTLSVTFNNQIGFSKTTTLSLNGTTFSHRLIASVLARDDGLPLTLPDLAAPFVVVENRYPFTSILQVEIAEIWIEVVIDPAPSAVINLSSGQVFVDDPTPTFSVDYVHPEAPMERIRYKVFSGSANVVDPDTETARLVRDSGEVFRNVPPNQSLVLTMDVLQPGSYRVAVKVTNRGGNGRWSAWAQQWLSVDILLPPGLAGLTATVGPNDLGVRLGVSLGSGPPETSAVEVETMQAVGHTLLGPNAALVRSPSGWTGTNAVVADWSGPPGDGETMIRATSTAAGTMTVASPRQPLPTIGKPLVMRVRSMPRSTPRYFAVECDFFDATGQLVDFTRVSGTVTSTFSSSPGSLGAAPGTLLPGSAPFTVSVSPIGAVMEVAGAFVGDMACHTPVASAVAFELRCSWLGTVLGEAHYLSSPTIHEGAWTPIVGGLVPVPNRFAALDADFEVPFQTYGSNTAYEAIGHWLPETAGSVVPTYLGPSSRPFLPGGLPAWTGASVLQTTGGDGSSHRIKFGSRFPINRGAGSYYLFDAVVAPYGGANRSFRLVVRWFAAATGGSALATSTGPTTAQTAARRWTPTQLRATPPAAAFYAEVVIEWLSKPTPEIQVVDRVSMVRDFFEINDRFAVRGSPQLYRVTPLRAVGGGPSYLAGSPSEITVLLPWDCAVHLVDESDPSRDTRIDMAGPVSLTTEVGIEAVGIDGAADPAVIDDGTTPRQFDSLTLMFGNDNDYRRVESLIRDGRRVLLRTPTGDGQTEQYWVRLGKQAAATAYNSHHGLRQPRVLVLSNVLVVEAPLYANVVVPEL